MLLGDAVTSVVQIGDGKEQGEGDLLSDVEEGDQSTAGVVVMTNLGAKLVKDVPDGLPLLSYQALLATERWCLGGLKNRSR